MTPNNKPLLLKAALTLSVIGSSIALAGYFLAAQFYEQAVEMIQSITNVTSTDGTSPLYFLIFGMLYCLSLGGVIFMIYNRRIGFWLYSLAQIVIQAFPVYWLGKNAFSTTNTIFTVMFILIYVSFYRRLR